MPQREPAKTQPLDAYMLNKAAEAQGQGAGNAQAAAAEPGHALVRHVPSAPPVGTPSGIPATAPSGPPLQSWNRADWQKLWLATQRASWRSLALVPSCTVPEGFTLDIAVSLVRTGTMHLGVPIRIADATHVPLAHLMQFKNEVESVVRSGDLVLLALGPIHGNPTTVSLAQTADLSLLCVPLGSASASDAKRTISEIGQKRFIGSASFKAHA